MKPGCQIQVWVPNAKWRALGADYRPSPPGYRLSYSGNCFDWVLFTPSLLSKRTLAPGHCLAILSISRGSPWAAILGFLFPSEGFPHVQFNLASLTVGLPWWLSTEVTCNAGDLGLIPGLGRSPEGHGNPLQYSCLENSMDRGAWWDAVHGVAKSRTWLSAYHSRIDQ